MQFLLLLPKLPHARDGGLLDRGGDDKRSAAVRHGWLFLSTAAAALRRRLGVGKRWADPSNRS